MKKFGRAIVSRYKLYRLKERSKLYLHNTSPLPKLHYRKFNLVYIWTLFGKKALTEEFTNASNFIFYTYTRDNTYGRVPLSHPPLVSNTLYLTTETEIIYICIWRLFGARVDVNLNLIMHKNLYLVPKFPKSLHRGRGYRRGIPPPTPSPLVSNTLYLTTLQQKRFPPPNHIPLVYGARVDVNLNLIMHNKSYLVPKFPKSPHTLPIRVQFIT